jgi:hypothetical protein
LIDEDFAHIHLPITGDEDMSAFRQGDKVQIVQRSEDQRWEDYMDEYIGYRGVVTDPDTVINDPEALVQITLEGTGGTHRFPQDCMKKVK